MCHAALWYHAAFHTVTAVVGAGVLGLPYTFSYLGWTGGEFCLTVACVTSFYTGTRKHTLSPATVDASTSLRNCLVATSFLR